MPARPARSDDPTGGRRLTHRLMRVLPACVVAGLVIGVPLAILAGDWRPAVAIPFALAALGGTIAAAVEDGRVQRDIDADRPKDPPAR